MRVILYIYVVFAVICIAVCALPFVAAGLLLCVVLALLKSAYGAMTGGNRSMWTKGVL